MKSVLLLAMTLLLVIPVHGMATVLTDQALESAARQLVQEAFRGQGEVTVHVGNIAALGSLRGTDAEIRARFLQTPRGRGPVLVSLEIHSQGRRLTQRTVSVRVQVWREVLVASRGIKRHAELDEGSLSYQRQDVRTLVDRAFTDRAEVLGLRIKKSMRPGDVLLARTLERVPLVQRGDEVSIQIRVGGVTVTAIGTAQADGAAGEPIDVKNNQSGKRLHCIVVSKNIVRVVEGPALRAER